MTATTALTSAPTTTHALSAATAPQLPADLMPPISGAFATSAARGRLSEACAAFAQAEGMIDIGAVHQHPPLYDTEPAFEGSQPRLRRLIIVDENWW